MRKGPPDNHHLAAAEALAAGTERITLLDPSSTRLVQSDAAGQIGIVIAQPEQSLREILTQDRPPVTLLEFFLQCLARAAHERISDGPLLYLGQLLYRTVRDTETVQDAEAELRTDVPLDGTLTAEYQWALAETSPAIRAMRARAVGDRAMLATSWFPGRVRCLGNETLHQIGANGYDHAATCLLTTESRGSEEANVLRTLAMGFHEYAEMLRRVSAQCARNEELARLRQLDERYGGLAALVAKEETKNN